MYQKYTDKTSDMDLYMCFRFRVISIQAPITESAKGGLGDGQ